MLNPDRQSKLVQLVMPDASPEEIADATARWFGFLEVINRLVLHSEKTGGDSPDKECTDKIDE